jgi:hypothetical protein
MLLWIHSQSMSLLDAGGAFLHPTRRPLQIRQMSCATLSAPRPSQVGHLVPRTYRGSLNVNRWQSMLTWHRSSRFQHAV